MNGDTTSRLEAEEPLVALAVSPEWIAAGAGWEPAGVGGDHRAADRETEGLAVQEGNLAFSPNGGRLVACCGHGSLRF